MTAFNRPSIPVLGQQAPTEELAPLPELSPFVAPPEPPQPTDRELFVLGEKNQSGLEDFGSELLRTGTNVAPGSALHVGFEAVGSLLGWGADKLLSWQTGKTPEQMALDLETRASSEKDPAKAGRLRKAASGIRQSRRAIGLTDLSESTLELASGSGSALTGQAGSVFGQQDPLSRQEYAQTLYNPEGWGAFTGGLAGSVAMSGLAAVQPSLTPVVLASFGAMGFVGGKQTYLDKMTELGVDPDPVVADMVGLASGLIELGSEYIGLDIIPEAIRGRVVSELAQAALAGEVRTASKTLARAIAQAAPAAAIEGIEEVAAQIGQNAAVLVGEMATTGNVPSIDEARARITEGVGTSLLGGAIAGSALSTPASLYGTVKAEKGMYRAAAKQKLERSNLGDFESIGSVDDKAIADAALGSNLYQFTVAGGEMGRKEAAAEAKRRGLTLTAQELLDPAGIEVAADDEKKGAMVQAVRARLVALSNLGVEDPSLSRGDIRSITGEANIGEFNSKAVRSRAVASMMQVEVGEVKAAKMSEQEQPAAERSQQETVEQEMIDKAVPGSQVRAVSRNKIGDRERSVESMARKLGLRVVWFSGRVTHNGKEVSTGGFASPDHPGTVFLRHSGGVKFDEGSMRDAYLGLVAHEASHDRELSSEGQAAVRNLLNAAFVRTPGLIGRMFGMKAKSVFGEMTKEDKIAWLESRGYSPDVIAQGPNESDEAHAKRVDSEVASVLQENPNLLEEIGAYSLIRDDVGMVRKGLDYVRRTITRMGLRGADAQAVLKYLKDSVGLAAQAQAAPRPSEQKAEQESAVAGASEQRIEARFSASNRQLGVFNAKLPQAIASMPQKKATPEQVIAHLKKSGVKDDEIKFSGLPEFLSGKKKVLVDEVMQAIEPVEVYETVLPTPKKALRGLRARLLAEVEEAIGVAEIAPDTPGGKPSFRPFKPVDYIDIRSDLAVAYETREQAEAVADQWIDSYKKHIRSVDDTDLLQDFGINVAGYWHHDDLRVPGDILDYFEVLLQWTPAGPAYYNNHFSLPNIVVHARVTIRDRYVDRDGDRLKSGRIMFVEEIQSDWHQRGREQGYLESHARTIHSLSGPSDYDVVISSEPLVKESDSIDLTTTGLISINGRTLSDVRAADKMHVALATYAYNEDQISASDPDTWLFPYFLHPSLRHGVSRDDVVSATRKLKRYTYRITHKTNTELEPIEVSTYGLAPMDAAKIVEAEITSPHAFGGGVVSRRLPDAPFKSSSAWSAFMLKRLLAMAASKPGVRELVVINGEATSDRYEQMLVRELGAIRIERTVDRFGNQAYRLLGRRVDASADEFEVDMDLDGIGNLEDYVGSNIAERIRSSAWIPDPASSSGMHFIEVSVAETDAVTSPSARGYTKFYDEIVVKQMNRVAEMVGAEVGTYTMEEVEEVQWMDFPSIKITPKVKETVASIGLPLFSSANKLQLGTYYSQLYQALSSPPQKLMTAQQIVAHLKKNGVKDEEIYWTGLSDFLAGKTGSIKVSDALQAVKPVELDDVMLDSPNPQSAYDIAFETEMQKYLVVGKGNQWRIKGSTLSEKDLPGKFRSEQEASDALNELVEKRVSAMTYREMLASGDYYGVEDMPQYGIEEVGEEYMMSGPIEGYAEMLVMLDSVGVKPVPVFTGGHFDYENVLVHARFTDRTGTSASGESFKTLFVEEIQSDWHQRGREYGYRESAGGFESLSFDVAPFGAKVELFTTEWSNAIRSGRGLPDLKNGKKGTWKPGATVSSNSILEFQFQSDKGFDFVWSVDSVLVNKNASPSDEPRLIESLNEGESMFSIRGKDLEIFPADTLSVDYGGKRLVSEIWKGQYEWEQKNKKRIAASLKPWVIQARWKDGTVAFTIAGIVGEPNDAIARLSSPGNRAKIEQYLAKRESTQQTVEVAPFKSSTSWASLALKRLLSFASSEFQTYAALSMITGTETAERYGAMLVNNVSEINVEMQDPDDPMNGLRITTKSVDGDTETIVGEYVSRELVRDYIGNEMAQQVEEGLDRGETQWTFTGSNMTVGKSGYQKFYDEIVVKEMEKIAKRAGARIETLSIDKGDGNTLQAPSIILDEASMQRIRSAGFPLFSASRGSNKGSRDEYGTYSLLMKLIITSPQRKMTPQQLISYLKKNGVKDEEIYWTGLDNYLSGLTSVNLDKVQDAIHPIVLRQEVNQEQDDDAIDMDGARDGAYDVLLEEYDIVSHVEIVQIETEDGEIVEEEQETSQFDVVANGSIINDEPFRRRRDADEFITNEIYDRMSNMSDEEIYEIAGFEFPVLGGRYSEYVLEGVAEEYEEILVTFNEAKGLDLPAGSDPSRPIYSSPHWDNTHNVLVAPRVTLRREAGFTTGHNVVFIEEVQSDWHQDAEGYITPSLNREIDRVEYEYFDLPSPIELDWAKVLVGINPGQAGDPPRVALAILPRVYNGIRQITAEEISAAGADLSNIDSSRLQDLVQKKIANEHRQSFVSRWNLKAPGGGGLFNVNLEIDAAQIGEWAVVDPYMILRGLWENSEDPQQEKRKINRLEERILGLDPADSRAAAIELGQMVKSLKYVGKFIRVKGDLEGLSPEVRNAAGSVTQDSWTASGFAPEGAHVTVASLEAAKSHFKNRVTRFFAADAPFKSSNAWSSLGLKRVIARAILEHGDRVDTVAIIDSVETAKRYGAALESAAQAVRIVKESGGEELFQLWIKRPGDADVQWERVYTQESYNAVTRASLPRWIGPTAADNLLQQIDQGQSTAEISGAQMTVGVNKYKQFYDVMLRKELEKIGKKYGATLTQVTLDLGPAVRRTPQYPQFTGIRITDEMREAVRSVGFPLFSAGSKFSRQEFNSMVIAKFSADYPQSGIIDETTGFILDDGTPVSMGVGTRMEDHRAIVGTKDELMRMGVSLEAANQAQAGSRTYALREIMRRNSVLRVHVNREDMSIEAASGQSVTSRQRSAIRDFLIENPKVSQITIDIETIRGDVRTVDLTDPTPDEVVHYLSFSASSNELRLAKAATLAAVRSRRSESSNLIMDSVNAYIDGTIPYDHLEAHVLNAMVHEESAAPGSSSRAIRSIMVPAADIERSRQNPRFSAGSRKDLTGEFWVSKSNYLDYDEASDTSGLNHEIVAARNAYATLSYVVEPLYRLPEFDGVHWIEIDADVYRDAIAAKSSEKPDMIAAWKEMARLCAENEECARRAMEEIGTEQEWEFAVKPPRMKNARQAIESIIEYAFMVGLDNKTVDSRDWNFSRGYIRIDGNYVQLPSIDSQGLKAIADAMYHLHGELAERQEIDIEVFGKNRRMFENVPMSVIESEQVSKLAPFRSAFYSASRNPIRPVVVPSKQDENYPVAKGLKAITARIAREMSQGKLDSYQGSRMISIVGLIGEGMLRNTGIRFRKLDNRSIDGYFDFVRDVLTISQASIEGGRAIDTLVHEFWHSASRFISDDVLETVKKDYERNLSLFIARHGFNPRWMTEDPNVVGIALKSGLPWTQIYKHMNLDEWIAVTMTERTMLLLGKTHGRAYQPGAIRPLVLSEKSKPVLRFLSDLFYQSVSDAARYMLGVENGIYDEMAEDFVSGLITHMRPLHDRGLEDAAYDAFQRVGNMVPFAVPEPTQGLVATETHPVTSILRQVPIVRDVIAARFSAGRKLRPIPTSVDESSTISSMMALARSQRFQNQYEFRLRMQEQVQRAAEAAGIDLSVDTPERRIYLARAIEAEARLAIAQKTNGVGWYNLKVRVALAVSSLVHPEIQSDPVSQFVFKVLLAISSNGMKVDKNFILADRMYESWKKNGKIPVDMGQGTATDAMNSSAKVLNGLVEKMGMQRLMELMTSRMTRKAAESALGVKITGEGVDTIVYGAAFLGPKIGNGFFANLNGNYEQLTMDRWYVRHWGRQIGKHIIIDKAAIAERRAGLRSFIDMLSSPKYVLLKKELEGILGFRLSKSRVDEVARAINNKCSDNAVRDRLMRIGVVDQAIRDDFFPIVGESEKRSPHVSVGNMTRKMGQRLVRWLDKRYEAPANIGERNEMREVMGTVLGRLRADFPALEMADLQAILWYPEKQLYDLAKLNTEQSEADDAEYDESEAPDYANAAIELARVKGIPETEIQKAVKNVETAIASERAAGAGGGAGAGSVPDGIQQALPGDAGIDGDPVKFSAAVIGPTRKAWVSSGYIPTVDEVSERWASFPGPDATYTDGEFSQYLREVKSDAWFADWFAGSDVVHVPTGLPAVCRFVDNASEFPVYSTVSASDDGSVPVFIRMRAPLRLEVPASGQDGLSEPMYTIAELESQLMVPMRFPLSTGMVIGGESRHTLVDAWAAQDGETQGRIAFKFHSAGFDGIKSSMSEDHPSATYIPFDSEQVKVVEASVWSGDVPQTMFSARPPGRIALTESDRKKLEGTKVVDANGDPISVWHGSYIYIERFMFDFLGGDRSWEVFGPGFNFTTFFEEARRIAISRTSRQQRGEIRYRRRVFLPKIGEMRPTVTKAFLAIKNPIVVNAVGTKKTGTTQLRVTRQMLDKFLSFAPSEVRKVFNGPALNSMVENLSDPKLDAIDKLVMIKKAFFDNEVEKFLFAARAATGHDGVKVNLREDNQATNIDYAHWIAWSPDQIVNGGGKYIDDVPIGSSFSAGRSRFDSSRWMRARAKSQDAYIQLEKAIADIESASGALPPSMNPLLAIRRMPGAIADRQKNFRTARVNPILGRMRDAGISMQQMGEYLFALHARERNEYIRQINPGSEGVGSGMNDLRAARIIGDVDARPDAAIWKSIAAEWHAITRESLETQLAAGLIRQSDFDAITSRYRHYVPMPDAPTGSGAPIEGEVKRFSLGRQQLRQTVGRGEDALEGEAFASVIPHIVGQRETIMSRAYRNIVANRFLMLAIHHPAPEMWSIFRPGTVRVMNVRTGVVEEVEDQSWRDDPQVMQVLAIRPMRYTTTEVVDGREVEVEHEAQRGEMVLVRIGDRELGETLTRGKLPSEHWAMSIVKVARLWSRWVRWTATSMFNPDFTLTNPVRDIQTALATVATEEKQASKIAMEMAKLYAPAFKAVMNSLRGRPSGALSDEWEMFNKLGGRQSLFIPQEYEERYEELQRELEDPTKWRTMSSGAKRLLVDSWDNLNTSFDNATRFAFFVAMIRNGVHPEVAVVKARNLTVDFSKRGSDTGVLWTMYAFGNAGLQGTAKTMRLLKSRRGRMIMGSLFAIGFINAMMTDLLGDDDDDKNGIKDAAGVQEYLHTTNLVIPTGLGFAIKIPVSYGLNVPIVMGRQLYRSMSGKVAPGSAIGQIVKTMLATFNPIGGEGIADSGHGLLRGLAPDVLDLPIDMAFGKDWMGNPLYKVSPWEQDPILSETGSTKVPEPIKAFSRMLNDASGGDYATKGYLDLPPDAVWYMLVQLAGGGGRAIERVGETIANAMRGEFEVNVVPGLRRFVEAYPTPQQGSAAYYAAREEVFALDARLGRYETDREKAMAMQRQPAEARSIQAFKDAESELKSLRARIREMRAAGASTSAIDAQERRMIQARAEAVRAYMMNK